MTIPNLDTMTGRNLRYFIASLGRGSRPLKQARDLFPDRHEGIIKATKLLRGYAWNRLTALEVPDLETKLKYLDICRSIKSRLPAWARWDQ